MRYEVIASCLHWGQKQAHQLSIILLIALLAITISFHAFRIYGGLQNSRSIANHAKAGYQVTPINKKIEYHEFKLLFGFNNASNALLHRDIIPKTHLNLTLYGALVAFPNDSKSSAIIKAGNHEQVYYIGDALPGGATLFEVHGNYVVLKTNNRFETLSFPSIGKATGIELFQQNNQP